MLNLALMVIFPLLVAYAAVTDLMTMTIPNWLSLALVGLFVVVAPFLHLPMSALLWHVGVAAIVLAVSFGCFACGWIGGGDAKLATALALWFGSEYIVNFLVAMAMAGGALTLFILQFRMFVLPQALIRQEWIARLHDRKAGVPYGIAMAAAALFTFADTSFLRLPF